MSSLFHSPCSTHLYGSKICFIIALLFLPLHLGAQQNTSEKSFDVVVVGGSSGAIGSAIGAARLGVSVVLIEDTPVLGGMLSNGISNIDCFSYESLSGVFDEFRRNVKEHYKPVMGSDPVFEITRRRVSASGRPSKAENEVNVIESRARQTNEAIEGGRWEPHVADKILKGMAAKYPNLTIYYNRFGTGVIKHQNRLIGVRTNSSDNKPITFFGKVIIDATHEGDIAAWAGAPYRVGREPRSREEPHAGEIYFYNRTGEIIPGGTGRQDFGIVSYGIRLCIKYYDPAKGTKHILASPPPGYDATKYEYAKYRSPDSFQPSMPNMKVEMNKNPIGNEMQEVNWRWPEADHGERKKLYQVYKDHALGFLYYLQHERGIRNIGLPKDEFKDNENIPYRVFVREARRIEGEETVTEADINPFIQDGGPGLKLRSNSIGIGHYPIDSKPVHSKTDMSTPDKGEGDFFLSNVITPFQVPFGAIIPKNVEGLVVPVALSATHVAFSAIRMDATWMVIGQAAGVAAAISVKESVAVREIPVTKIQDELLKQKCKLAFYWDVPIEHPYFADIQKATVSGWIDPDMSFDFYPDSLLTRAQAAQLLVKAFDVWPSVSNVHFTDVDYRHEAFVSVETLFDIGVLDALGIVPRWPQAGGYAEASDGFDQIKSNFGEFFPDKPMSGNEFHTLARRILLSTRKTGAIHREIDPPAMRLTKGEAVAYLMKLIN